MAVEMLGRAGADLSALMMRAARDGLAVIAQTVLNTGTVSPDFGMKALEMAKDPEVVCMLVRHGVPVHQHPDLHYALLKLALESCCYPLRDLLMSV
jgi:hypothetical protein